MSDKNLERVFQHIVEVGSGNFELTQDEIMAEEDESLCEILIGLLTLKEDLEFHEDNLKKQRDQLRVANEELRLANRKAENASRAKSEFLSSMSHELRTPLNAIIGYSELLIEDAEDVGDSQTVADLDKIKGAGRHLLSLVSDVLDLSKIEAGKMEVSLRDFDVASLISDVVSIVTPLMAKNENEFVVAVSEDIGTMRSDVVKIRQNLLNLLSNSAKFTSGGRITLSVQRMGESGVSWFEFSVADSGIGMTPEQSAKIFQSYAQADDAATTESFGGTGLGLAITKQFSNMLGGDVTVESELGRGSTFTLTLPAIAPSEM